jgi:hypothetical protein
VNGFNQHLGNIFAVYARSDSEDRAFGATAYRDYRNTIAEMAAPFHVDAMRACGIFAALSPNIDEAANFKGLVAVMAGKPDSECPGYPINKNKAREILKGKHPLEVLKGLKTRAFFVNIADPETNDAVVVDAHIHSVWLLKRQLVTQSYLPPKLYHEISNDVRTAARFIGCGIRPNQLQATLWCTWKRVNNIVFNNHQRKLF